MLVCRKIAAVVLYIKVSCRGGGCWGRGAMRITALWIYSDCKFSWRYNSRSVHDLFSVSALMGIGCKDEQVREKSAVDCQQLLCNNIIDLLDLNNYHWEAVRRIGVRALRRLWKSDLTVFAGTAYNSQFNSRINNDKLLSVIIRIPLTVVVQRVISKQEGTLWIQYCK